MCLIAVANLSVVLNLQTAFLAAARQRGIKGRRDSACVSDRHLAYLQCEVRGLIIRSFIICISKIRKLVGKGLFGP